MPDAWISISGQAIARPRRNIGDPCWQHKCRNVHVRSSHALRYHLLLGNLDGALVDALNDIVGSLLVDSAADTLAGTENLLGDAGEVLAERLEAHRPRNLDDLIKRDVAVVGNVLNLLAVARGL